ncbi:MAG: GNAT family N-acetyltransferase [Saprospiraceae bacterium]|nr:GNAT family N-acetyltransferase [Saprospiraceae bacterium]
MKIEAIKTTLAEIEPLRAMFLQEHNFQIRYNACHERGWSDSWLLVVEGEQVGYGSVKGKEDLGSRDAVFEFFLLPEYRKTTSLAFAKLLAASGATHIECQSNELMLTSLLFEFSRSIRSEVVLFEDHHATERAMPDAVFRTREPQSKFSHRLEPVGDYVLEKDGKVIATGGFMTHYNPPFADLYFEVEENYWGKGFASFLLQEIKKECYRSDRVPAARCSIQNQASRGAMTNAGLRVCGFILEGAVVK